MTKIFPKNLKRNKFGTDHITSNFLKAILRKFYLVYS